MAHLHATSSWFEAAMLHIAATVSHFEAETLQIPPSLRFFTVGAEPDELSKQAIMFCVAPLHTFATLPLMDAFAGRYELQP